MGYPPEHTDQELTSAFLANVSHELRTPLNAVLGMLELALDEDLSSTVRDYLTTACESTRTLTKNLNLLLALAEAESREAVLRLEPINVEDIVHGAIDGLAVATRERAKVKLETDLPADLWGDSDRLRQILAALIEHSARWLESSRLAVGVRAEASADSAKIIIGISERGLESPEAVQDYVAYDPVESAKYAAAGLALAVARRWIERMEGQLWTDSLTSGGRFQLELELLRRPIPAEHAANPQETKSSRGRRAIPARDSARMRPPRDRPLEVLVVDDTEANQKVVKEVLAKRGHRVQLAADGQQALERVRERTYDVVLMDAQMPTMNGFEATAAIRKLPDDARSHVPIIAMTAHAREEDRLRCLAAGMDDYLAKPIDVATLVSHVEFYGSGSPLEPIERFIRRADGEPQKNRFERDFLAGARARLAGDETLLLELIRLFRQDAGALLDKIQAGISCQDSEAAARAAHNLRGLAANFDDTGTIDAADGMERAAQAGDWNAMRREAPILADELARLVAALTDYEQRVGARRS